jgi:hypothetical protein
MVTVVENESAQIPSLKRGRGLHFDLRAPVGDMRRIRFGLLL